MQKVYTTLFSEIMKEDQPVANAANAGSTKRKTYCPSQPDENAVQSLLNFSKALRYIKLSGMPPAEIFLN
ncbi:MAG: hypothetical protein KKA07_18655 [Bacteroidetes bacterium]|nr:hypothetical protein [Bacteroidota bacterium]MBU1721093.1 hypothetical protein [Bacteroidota bacterium]